MKYIIYALIWLNCSCPSTTFTLTDTYASINTNAVYQMPDNTARCEPRMEFVESIDPLIERMSKEHSAYGLVQPRTAPDKIYRLTMKGGKVIEAQPVVIEPIIEKRTEWIEKEKETIKGFKVKE